MKGNKPRRSQSTRMAMVAPSTTDLGERRFTTKNVTHVHDRDPPGSELGDFLMLSAVYVPMND